MIYVNRTNQHYANNRGHIFQAANPETVAVVKSYREANRVICDLKKTDPTGLYYTSCFCVGLKRKNITVEGAMQKLLDEITAKFEDFKRNATDRIERGNKTAGVRSRKNTLALEKLFKKWRSVSIHDVDGGTEI